MSLPSAVVLKLEHASESPEGLVNTQIAELVGLRHPPPTGPAFPASDAEL